MLKNILFISFIVVSISTWAQDNTSVKDSISLSDNKIISFETYYYDALNEKIKGNHREAVELLRLALRFKPSNADAQYEISINYKSLKDYRKAILFGENAVRFRSDNKWYWLNVAELYSLVGDNLNAEKSYEKLAKVDSKFVPEYIKSIARTGETEIALKKVNIFLKSGSTEELLVLKRDLLIVNKRNIDAISLTNELISFNPTNVNYYYDISELLLKDKQFIEAEKFITTGLELLPNNPILVRQNFKVLMQQNHYDEAFVILEEAFENSRLNFNEKLGFVIDFVEADKDQKQVKELIKALEKWVENTHEEKIYPIIGNLYKIQNDNLKALESFRKGFNSGYTEFSGLIEMLILEQELGKYDLLLADSDKMLELFPSHPVLYLFKGFAANQTGDYKYSVDALVSGLDFVVNNDKLKSEFHSMLADSYSRLNDMENSLKEFDKALELDPENISILNNYSYFLAENGKNLDKALEMINIVISVESNNAMYLDTQAWIYYKKGEFEQARKILKRVITSDDAKSADILEHYGDILYKLNKVNLAVEHWEKAYKLAGTSIELKEKINNRALLE